MLQATIGGLLPLEPNSATVTTIDAASVAELRARSAAATTVAGGGGRFVVEEEEEEEEEEEGTDAGMGMAVVVSPLDALLHALQSDSSSNSALYVGIGNDADGFLLFGVAQVRRLVATY